MADKKIVAVVRAIGSPDGGLARAALADQDHVSTARTVTTNISSPRATDMAAPVPSTMLRRFLVE